MAWIKPLQSIQLVDVAACAGVETSQNKMCDWAGLFFSFSLSLSFQLSLCLFGREQRKYPTE